MNTNSIYNLSVAEKLQLVEDLWDEIALRPTEVPLPEWQKEELLRRQERLLRYPDMGLTWDQIVAEVRKNHVS